MTRVILAALVAIHGVIHLIGFVVPWRIATLDGFAYRTATAGGALDLGDAGVRLVGLVWLVCAVGFIVAGVGIALRATWGLPLAGGLAVVSLVVCLLGLPETVAGIAVDVVILGAVTWLMRTRTSAVEVAR